MSAHTHAHVVYGLGRAAEDLEGIGKTLAQSGAVADPPCQRCLLASAWLTQLTAMLWLLRWTHFSEVIPTGTPSLPER